VETRTIPDSVLRTWPEIPADAWEWLSENRLRAPHRIEGFDELVVVAYGTTIGRGCRQNEEMQRDVYADLFVHAAQNSARRDACANGTPVVRPDNEANYGVAGRCWWCGRWPTEHEAQAVPEPRVDLADTRVMVVDRPHGLDPGQAR
jgi:hypothetical protein